MKVLAFGEILWDIINGEEHLGGAPFNFAAHSARCGNESFIISRVGDDDLGVRAFNQCEEYGVKNDFVQWDNQHATGTVLVTLEAGQPDYVIHENVAYDFISYDEDIFSLPRGMFDVFYFGSLAQRSGTSSSTLYKILSNFSFRHVFYDVNLRKNGYTKDILQSSLEFCTILKLNADEVPVLAALLNEAGSSKEDFCAAMTSRYRQISTIVITASEKGCYVYSGNQLVYIPGKKVEVKDAVGAGDAFSAAFMHIFTRENDPLKAATIANELGAFVATQTGAIPDYSPHIKALLQGDRSQRIALNLIL